MENAIVGGLIGILGTLSGVFLLWWLNKREKAKIEEWDFFVDTTVEVLLVIDLLSTTNIQLNFQNILSRLLSHFEKLKKVKCILEIRYNNETREAFIGFYKATLEFADELRAVKSAAEFEKFDSYKLFQINKNRWLNLIKRKSR